MLTNQPRIWHVGIAFDHIAREWRTTVSRGPEQSRAGLVGRLITRSWLYSVVILLLASCPVAAACVDPSALAHSTASITRTFSEEERKANSDVIGISGTGWFLAPGSMATVAHVAEAMHLSGTDWKQIEIWDGQSTQSVPARILRIVGSQPERIAVLELRNPFPRAQVLPIRTEPLVPDERVTSVAYPNNRLRFAGGRFVEYGAEDRLAGTALFELYDGNDRLVLDHGASGAPVLDCEGRVVAVVSNLMTQKMQFQSRVIRIPTAWQQPNVVCVPVRVLKDLAQAD
jgi:Trypsin-like peptidase domain